MVLLSGLWAIFIFLATCTSNVYAFLHELRLSFTFDWKPDWQSFAFFYPLDQLSQVEMISHFIMFFGFTLLLAASFSLRVSAVIAVAYAFLTEYLQLHFSRGAEMYDIVANLIGVFVAMSIVVCAKRIRRKARLKWSKVA